MERDNDVKQQLIDRINKKRKVLTGIGVAGAIAAALSVPLTIGVGASVIANDISASKQRETIRASLHGTTAYETFVDAKRQQLKDDFAAGKMSYSDFTTQYERVALFDTVREFAEETNNEVLTKQLDIVDEHENASEKSLSKDMIGCLLLGAAGGITFSVAEAIDKKYKTDLRNLGVEEKELAD